MQESFRLFSRAIADKLGSNYAFLIALLVVILWGITGPMFGFSDTWQLVINTGTTIVTFLMVFLIQNTQNRDAMAMQVKLDELLRAITEARTSLVDLENRSDDEMQRARGRIRGTVQGLSRLMLGPFYAARTRGLGCRPHAQSGSSIDIAHESGPRVNDLCRQSSGLIDLGPETT